MLIRYMQTKKSTINDANIETKTPKNSTPKQCRTKIYSKINLCKQVLIFYRSTIKTEKLYNEKHNLLKIQSINKFGQKRSFK